jgi:hypothetical protein
MLNTEHCEEYLAEVRAAADEMGPEWRQKLEEQLEYLGSYACHDDPGQTRCDLTKDFAPLSFYFLMQRRQKDGSYKTWFNGGLIFHGPHDRGGDGGAPTYSVNLCGSHGWSVHT